MNTKEDYKPLLERVFGDDMIDVVRERIENRQERVIDKALSDAGVDPDALVKRALKQIELPERADDLEAPAPLRVYDVTDEEFEQAAAVLGDAGAVNFVALTASERFTAVQTGDVDVLMRNTTWTQSRDSSVGMDFGPTTYYDGQQLMARVSDGFSGSSSVADIDGSVVCTNVGTTTEKNIAEAALLAGAEITLLGFETSDEVYETFIAGGCDITTTDGSALVGRKAKMQPADQEWVIFPATPISKEPLGPTYGQNDSAWADAVNWTVYAMIIMDEYGVTSANVDATCATAEAEVARLCGGDGELQTAMGLSADAFHQVIKQVGSYGEVYDRNLNPVGLYREGSANAGWLDGGLIYSPPAR